MKKLKFFNLHDLLMSVIPGILTIHSTIKDLEMWVSIACGVAVLISFIIIIIKKNIGVYKKELAEILANGYFMNFLENLSKNLVELRNEVEFSNDKVEYYDLDKISVQIIIPKSNNKLGEVADKLNDSRQLESINLKNRDNNSGFWVRGQKNGEELIIKDFPRTLFSLPKYFKNELGEEYSEDKSKKYHRIFIDKLKKLISDNYENRKLAKFELIEE